jgi:hypothetical protein
MKNAVMPMVLYLEMPPNTFDIHSRIINLYFLRDRFYLVSYDGQSFPLFLVSTEKMRERD